nr:ribosomal protein S8 [Actinocyclus sp. mgcode 4]
MNKLIWNLISSLKNAQLANKTVIFQKKNNICFLFLNILWDEGFILGFRKSVVLTQHYEIYLKFNDKNHLSSFLRIKILYKPNTNLFFNVQQLWKLNLTTEILILSTSKGLFTHNQCRKYNLGGKPLILLK